MFFGREVVRQGAKPSLSSWIEQQQLLENEAVGRWREITGRGDDYKGKNPQCEKLDAILLNYVKQYKAGKLNDDQYFSECVDAIAKAWSPNE